MSSDMTYITLLQNVLKEFGDHPFCNIEYFYFSLNEDSKLSEGAWPQKIQESGIKTSGYVGDWIANILEETFGQHELAKNFRKFLNL